MLHVDRYVGFEPLADKGDVVLAACWSHARRRFYEVAQATNAPIATEALRRIAELYAIEAGFAVSRLRTGSRIVNELRRVKTGEELAAIGRAIDTVEHAMAAVAPLVVPGVSMVDLVEAVEHELRAAGSRCPSFATHIFTGLGDDDFDSGRATGR